MNSGEFPEISPDAPMREVVQAAEAGNPSVQATLDTMKKDLREIFDKSSVLGPSARAASVLGLGNLGSSSRAASVLGLGNLGSSSRAASVLGNFNFPSAAETASALKLPTIEKSTGVGLPPALDRSIREIPLPDPKKIEKEQLEVLIIMSDAIRALATNTDRQERQTQRRFNLTLVIMIITMAVSITGLVVSRVV